LQISCQKHKQVSFWENCIYRIDNIKLPQKFGESQTHKPKGGNNECFKGHKDLVRLS